MILYFKSEGRLVRVDFEAPTYLTAINSITIQAFNERMTIDGAILRSVQKGETE